jgi:hypothetical protein
MKTKKKPVSNGQAKRIGAISPDERILGARAYCAYVRASKKIGAPITRFESWLHEWIECHRAPAIEEPDAGVPREPERDYRQLWYGKGGHL